MEFMRQILWKESNLTSCFLQAFSGTYVFSGFIETTDTFDSDTFKEHLDRMFSLYLMCFN